MLAIFGALIAGALTTLAPCSLSLLPIIVGGSLQGADRGTGFWQRHSRAVVIAGSLAVSVFVFTLLLKASTALIGVSPQVWALTSGVILVLLGLSAVFPAAWDRFAVAVRLNASSAEGLQRAGKYSGLLGAVATGAALGPVFTSCSPLYGYVIVTVLPASPGRGLMLLGAYVLGLAAVLLAIAVGGRALIARVRWAADPHSWFRRGLGVLFVIVGLLIATGLMQEVETWVLINSPIQPWELGPQIGS